MLVDPLQAASGGPTRDLALFDRAIDSKPRGCDVVRRKVEEVAPQGVAAARCEWR
jgi:hypothetical protein